ncbi:MAG: FAD-dependent oxidoreductase, partial [Thermoanaerobaculia bacterium]
MATEKVLVPDIGDFGGVDVVEVLVSGGDRVAVEESLITLESEKATMDVPSPLAGRVAEVKVKVGDQVSAGDLILTLETEEEETGEESAEPSKPPTSAEATSGPGAPAAGPSIPPIVADLQAEVVVLGSGPGGYTAAFRAADLGKKVILVERFPELGGVCLVVGCIPSKALLHVAGIIEAAADLGEHGVDFGPPTLDLERLRAWKDAVVGRLTQGIATMAKKRKVEVLQGTGRLTSPHTLAVATEEGETTVGFETAILAVGSRAMELPGIPYDDPRVMGSTGALRLEEIPKRLLLVGGGIIGLEMAMVYGALGSELTVVELLDGLIPGCDRDLVRPLERRLKKRYGARIYLETRVTEIVAQKRSLKALLEGKGAPASATFERVLMAVGRQPNGDRIGAEAAGVELDERGTIPVDRQQRTNVHHI